MEAQLATKEGETPFSATTQTGRKGTVLSEAGQTEGDGQHKMSLTRGIQKTNRSRRRLTDTAERLVAGGGELGGEQVEAVERQRCRGTRQTGLVQRTHGEGNCTYPGGHTRHACTGQTAACTHTRRYCPPDTLQLKRQKIHACGDLCTAACRSFPYNTHRPGGAQRAINKRRLHGCHPAHGRALSSKKEKIPEAPDKDGPGKPMPREGARRRACTQF